MLIKNIMVATTNMDYAMSEMSMGAKVLYLGDPMSIPDIPNIIRATLLVPDYNCLRFFADGMIGEYQKQYLRLLNSPGTAESFASIIALLYKGVKVILFFPEENKDLDYAETLLKYIRDTFGITAQSKSTEPMYNTAYDTANARLLHMYKLISGEDFIFMSEELNDFDIDRLKPEMSEKWNIPVNLSNAEFAGRIITMKENMKTYGSVNVQMMKPIAGN